MLEHARHSLKAALPGLVALLIAGAGCSTNSLYSYRPVEQVTSAVEGNPAARYAIPPESPRGDVRIASFGVTDIERSGEPDWAALHLRFVISNDSGAQPWTVDTRQITLELRDKKNRPAPGLVNADEQDLPVVTVPPRQVRTVDLYYPLPEGMEEAEDVPAFDVLWTVQTDTRAVTERTPFERFYIDRSPPEPSVVIGYGASWWDGPWHPGYTVVQPVVIERTSPRPAPRVRIRARPSR